MLNVLRRICGEFVTLLFTSLSLFIIACSEKEPIHSQLITKDGHTINVDAKEVITISPNALQPQHPILPQKGAVIDTLYGGIPETSSPPNNFVKIQFRSTFKKLLPNRIYYARVVAYKQSLPIENYLYTPYKIILGNMGFYSPYNDLIGFHINSQSRQFVCTTYLYSIEYDSNLTPIKEHYPCPPKSLQWLLLKEQYDWGIE